jgi:hypothetical protein
MIEHRFACFTAVAAVISRIFVFVATTFLVATATLAEESPANFFSLHPDNPHYFLWRGESTVLVTSGEHYGAVLNLDFDYVAYLDELQKHGLNHTRTFSGVYREDAAAFKITENTLAPASGRYISPWARSDQSGYHAGGNRFDLTKWDPAYFERLKDFLSQAARRGIVVELTLFCPMYRDDMWNDCPMNSANNVNSIGTCPREEVYTLRHPDLLDVQLAFTRKIVRELRDFDNLYYEVCNEPYFGGVTMEWQHRIADAIVEQEKELPQRHLISLNIANGRAKVQQPHSAISLFNFHYCVPPDVVAMNYDLEKAIGENETGFRGHDDVLYRTEGWDFLLAGGALYNNLDYSFTASHPGGTLRDYQSPGGGSVELRQQLGILKDFLVGFDFVHMRPNDSVVRGVSPDLTTHVLANLGQEYAIYLHVPLPHKPKRLADHLRSNINAKLKVKLPAGQYTAEWLDPLSGEITKTDRIAHQGGTAELRSPRFANDVALRITRSP